MVRPTVIVCLYQIHYESTSCIKGGRNDTFLLHSTVDNCIEKYFILKHFTFRISMKFISLPISFVFVIILQVIKYIIFYMFKTKLIHFSFNDSNSL